MSPTSVPSTILDLTGAVPTLLRAGAVSVDRLRTVASVIADDEGLAAGTAGFKPAAPHPMEGGMEGGGAGRRRARREAAALGQLKGGIKWR